MSDLVDAARDALMQVIDPEAGLNIVDLGLIYDIQPAEGGVKVTMTFTTDSCPAGPLLIAAAEQALLNLPSAPDVTIELTFEPPWTIDRITPEGRSFLGSLGASLP